MFINKYTSAFIVILLFSFLIFQTEIKAQEAESPDDQVEVVEEDLEESDILDSSSIWDLVGQAGGIRYPIYAILIVGIFLISLRSYELYNDKIQQKDLVETSFRNLSLNEISSKISIQQDYMLSRIMAKLLNVFQTNRNADYLHDEISNYNTVQQGNFNTFKNRIDFLSDTAGALGLLGTVWGMFMVFSSGTLEREVILVGMGIALLSTFLGLVVSIILNFCSTLTEGYFSKHLESVTTKADELRFRLIELSETPTAVPVTANVNNNSHSKEVQQSVQKKAPEKNSKEDQAKPVAKEQVNEPAKIVLSSDIKPVSAGDSFDEIQVKLMGTMDGPVSGSELEMVLEGEGKVNGKNGKYSVKTDENGIAAFQWTPDSDVGEKRAFIRSKENKKTKLVLNPKVIAGEPETLKLLNNHQAGIMGNQLEKPVSVIVTDKFENPVSSINVLLKVTMGNGTFSNGRRETTAVTDEEGKVFIDFTLGSEPGFNAIDITLPKYNITKSFQAVGQEVTV
ncbi:MAG: MotA/TolQ/ExbB proton channel family protein [Balneolaceae bacterium]|nr:MotA/TolQ/ExbB proton channel family protein [Balneolaceae bacterium]